MARRVLSRKRVGLRLRLSVPNTRDGIREAVTRVAKLARKEGCLDERRTDFEIALHEALANAVIHGNRGDPGKRVHLRCYGEKGAGVLILVRDEGAGFRPEDIPDPTEEGRVTLQHGRGLYILRSLSDHMEHRKSGREILFCFLCR